MQWRAQAPEEAEPEEAEPEEAESEEAESEEAGLAGSGGNVGGSTPLLPGVTAEEVEILEPLFVADEELERASLQELVELGARVGLAHGYAMCRCALYPKEPPESVPGLVSGCAVDESGGLRGFNWNPSPEQGPRPNEDLARCFIEGAVQTPGLEEALRCALGWHQDNGLAWLGFCSVPHEPNDSTAWPLPARNECPLAEELSQTLAQCQSVGYCADGSRVSPGRCNGSRECADASDERGCYDCQRASKSAEV